MDKMIESPELGQTPADIVWKLRSAATLPKSMVAVAIALNAAADEIERLRSIIKPFALAAEHAEDDEADEFCLDGSSARYELTLGDLRRAAARR